MTLATLSDKERADLLRLLCTYVGLDYDKTTPEALKERVALIDELADRYQGLLR